MSRQLMSQNALDEACWHARTAGLKILEDLVVAAGAGRQSINDVVANAMTACGAELDTLRYNPSKVPLVDEFAQADALSSDDETCLIGKINGDGTGRSLILFAHPDVEPAGVGAPWTMNPFAPTQREGRLHGWGVADDLAGIAMMLQTAAVLQATDVQLKGDLMLVGAPSKAHRRGIAAALHSGLHGDAAVYLHPAESGRGLDEIKAFSPGQLEFKITVKGRPPQTSEPAHTAFAHLGVNPFDKSMVVAKVLQDLNQDRGSRISHPRLEHAVGRSTNLMITRCEFQDPEALSRMPGECRLFGAVSLVPSEEIETVMKYVEQALFDAAKTDSWLAENLPELEWISGVTSAETPDEHELYQLVAGELTRLGASPQVNPLHTASDIRNPIVQKNIATVGFGPRCGGLSMSGLSDEWIDIEDYHRAISACVSITVNWCGVAGNADGVENAAKLQD